MSKRTVSRATTRRPAPKKRAPSKRRKPGPLDQLVAALPFSERTLNRIATWSIVVIVAAVAFGVASWFGIPAMAGRVASEAVGDVGFRLDKIDITGLRRMDRNTVYAEALDQKSRAMPLVDLEGVRERLLKYPYIEDARISRRLPDTLVIHIVEREPAAVWQNHGALILVDAKGVALEPVSREAMPDLPLLIGDGANLQGEARRKLLNSAPALKPLVKAATWVGNRRWDLIFDTGEKLQLPEGEKDAAVALAKFGDLDTHSPLLGRGHISFDMRDPDNLVIRTPRASPPPIATSAPAASPSATPSPAGSEE